MILDEISYEQRIIIDRVKKVVKERIAPIASEMDKEGVFRWDIARTFLGKLGLFQIISSPIVWWA